jgi:ATP-binding cassette, subfamily C, bacterial CydCD
MCCERQEAGQKYKVTGWGRRMQPGTKPNKNALRWLRRQSRAARRWLLISIVLGLAGGLLIVAQAWLISRIVHGTFMGGFDGGRAKPLFIALIVVVALKAVIAWGREIAGFQAGAAVRGQVRRDLSAHLVAVGPAGLNPLPAGRLVSNALEQVEALHNFVARYVPQLALAALLPLLMLVFIFPICWATGTILLVTAPLIPLFMILVGMGAESISQRHFQALARMSAHFLDVLQGLPTLKLFSRSKAQAATIQAVSGQYRRRTMAVLRVAFISSAVLEFFSSIAIALVAVYLGMYYLGYLDFGDYGRPIDFASGFFILLLAPDFFLPLRELGAHYHARADAVGATEEILKIFDLPAAAAQPLAVRTTTGAPETIRFESVSVQYGAPSRPGLDAVSLTCKRGERIAVVGASGAGKSTMIHLLLGFIQPTEGRILIDGVPLNAFSQSDWRRQTAWIGQNPMLFSGTVSENIGLAHPDAGDGPIEAAARHAGVMEFTAKKESGLDTEVGEQGKRLSMGQAQRVALARAFLKDAPLLLLDEPTASLDTRTEAQILAELDRWGRGRTIFMATHRPAPLTLADRILILEQGRLVADGSYAELRRTHGDLLPTPPSDTVQPPENKSEEHPFSPNINMNPKPQTPNHKLQTINPKPGLRSFIGMLGRHWRALALGTGLAFLATGAAIGLLCLSGWFLAASALAGVHAATAQAFNFFYPSVAVRLLAMARTVTRYGERIVSHDATFRILETLRTWCYSCIEPLVPARLGRLHSGDLLSRIITDIDTLDNLYLRVLSPTAVAAATVVLLFIFIVRFNCLIALVAVAALVLGGAGIPVLAQRMALPAARRLNERLADLRTALVDGIHGMAALLSCGAEDRFLLQLDTRHSALLQNQKRMSRVTGLTGALLGLTAGLAIVATLFIGVTAAGAGSLTGPHLAMLTLAVMAAFEAVSSLPVAYQYLGQTRRSAARLHGVTEVRPAVDYPERSEGPQGAWDIDLQGVTFSYQDADRPALERIDLHIPAGRHLAVMGDTGAGKSTLLYLLARFEDPWEGRIRLAGHPLAGFSEEDLRRAICIIDQRSHIFSGTIADNLLLARSEARDEELWNALDGVRMRDFVHNLPEGLRTWVGEAGRLLSGGQARRLAVARVLLSDAPIWILDEPTEGLDAETADAVMKTLLARGKDKTVIVVTHQNDIARKLDEVLILRAGRIVAHD